MSYYHATSWDHNKLKKSSNWSFDRVCYSTKLTENTIKTSAFLYQHEINQVRLDYLLHNVICHFPACPVGSYSKGDECESCPPNSNTLLNASSSVVQCQCNRGYAGPPGGPCQEIFCSELSAPDNGEFNITGYKVGGTATFACFDGYVVERGSTTRTCQIMGDWDGTPPFCARK